MHHPQVNAIARMFLSSEEMADKRAQHHQSPKLGHPRRPPSWRAAGVHKLAAQSPGHPALRTPQSSQSDIDLAGSWAVSIFARAKAAEVAAMKDAASLAATRMGTSNKLASFCTGVATSSKLASFCKGLGLGMEKMNPDFRSEFNKKEAWIEKEKKEAEERAQQEEVEAQTGGGHHEDAVPLPPTGGAVVNTVTGGSSSQGGSSSSDVQGGSVQNPEVHGENHVVEGEPGSVQVRSHSVGHTRE